MAYIAQCIVNPTAVAPLLDQPGRFHQFEVAADVRLGFAKSIAEFTDAQAALREEQATGGAESDAFAECSKEIAALVGGHFHIFKYMNILLPCQAEKQRSGRICHERG